MQRISCRLSRSGDAAGLHVVEKKVLDREMGKIFFEKTRSCVEALFMRLFKGARSKICLDRTEKNLESHCKMFGTVLTSPHREAPRGFSV